MVCPFLRCRIVCFFISRLYNDIFPPCSSSAVTPLLIFVLPLPQGQISASFIFCKNDSRTSSLDVFPAPTFSVIFPDACPVVAFRQLAREVMLRDRSVGDWSISYVKANVSVANVKNFLGRRLVICVYTNEKGK